MAKNRLITNLINRRSLTQRAWWRITLILSMTLAYGAVFFPLRYFWGDGVSLLLLVPILVCGWSFGPGFGVVYSLLACLFNLLLWGLSGMVAWNWQFAFVAAVMLLTFTMAGYLAGRISLTINRRFLSEYAPGELAVVSEQNRLPGNFESAVSGLVNFMPDPAFAINLEKKVVAWNQAMEALSGLRADEVLGKPCSATALPFYGSQRTHLAEYVIQNPRQIPVEFPEARRDGLFLVLDSFFEHLRPDGIHLRIKAAPLFNLDGDLVGAVQSLKDITETRIRQERDGNGGSIDIVTGLYTADAFRVEIARLENSRICPNSIILVRFTIGPAATRPLHSEDLVKRYVPFIQGVFRLTDVIAYLGESEVAILLPRADAKVTQQIADRLRIALTMGKTNRAELPVSSNVVAITCQEVGDLYETLEQGRQLLKEG